MNYIGQSNMRPLGKSIAQYELFTRKVWAHNLRDKNNRRMIRRYIKMLRQKGQHIIASHWQAYIEFW